MNFMERVIYSGLVVNLFVGIILVFFGIHLIRNNKVITTNLLQNISIFETKEVKRAESEVKPSKYITSRIMLYLIGSSFIIGGLVALVNFVKGVTTK